MDQEKGGHDVESQCESLQQNKEKKQRSDGESTSAVVEILAGVERDLATDARKAEIRLRKKKRGMKGHEYNIHYP